MVAFCDIVVMNKGENMIICNSRLAKILLTGQEPCFMIFGCVLTFISYHLFYWLEKWFGFVVYI